MEDFKNPKADLIAIYRLEFYKKQKSWKLSTNAKNKKRDVSGKIKYPLNKTYDVVQPQTNVCELNEAFIDTGSENTSSNHQPFNPATPTSPKQSTYNYQNELYNWQSAEITDHPQNYIHPKLNSPQTEPKFIWTGDNLHYYGNEQDHPNLNGCSEKGELQCWFDKNKNWTPLPETKPLWTREWPVMNALNCGDNATNAFYTAEETIPPKMECSWLPDGEELRRIQENAYYYTEDEWDAKSELSTDSWSEFMRGADLAPHSSEVELSLPNESMYERVQRGVRHGDVISPKLFTAALEDMFKRLDWKGYGININAEYITHLRIADDMVLKALVLRVLSDVELDENLLTRLSSAQLRVAVQSHARVLRRLLREESKRKRIRSFLSLTDRTTDRPVITPRAATDFSNYDEYPTRDINLSSHYYTACNAMHRARTFTKTTEDTFVAGSHNNADLEVLGRGRGKIQAASGSDSRKRIIGIERGRPFRL